MCNGMRCKQNDLRAHACAGREGGSDRQDEADGEGRGSEGDRGSRARMSARAGEKRAEERYERACQEERGGATGRGEADK